MVGIIFIGPPCSGKSTIAKKISSECNIPYISSGDIARKMAEENSDIKERLSNGMMAPEYKMRHMMYTSIKECISSNQSFILDGFPRFIEQYEWLISTFVDIKFICVYVMASVPTIYTRNRRRGRDDDGIEAFTQRVRYFNENTLPLVMIAKYLHKVRNDSDCNNDDVFNATCDIVRGVLDDDDSEVR